MSLYAGTKATDAAESLESILKAADTHAQIVLIEDGPLTNRHYKFLDQLRDSRLVRVPLPKNVGLASALNIGLDHCTYQYIFRCDADDIYHEDRFSAQHAHMLTHQLDVCSAPIIENWDLQQSVKYLPTEDHQIRRYAKFRSPFNHMCVSFKKDLIQSVGSYPNVDKREDYALWILLLNIPGVKFGNMDRPLVKVSAGNDLINRRVTNAVRLEYQFFMYLYTNIGMRAFQYSIGFLLRVLIYSLPKSLIKLVYSKIRSKRPAREKYYTIGLMGGLGNQLFQYNYATYQREQGHNIILDSSLCEVNVITKIIGWKIHKFILGDMFPDEEFSKTNSLSFIPAKLRLGRNSVYHGVRDWGNLSKNNFGYYQSIEHNRDIYFDPPKLNGDQNVHTYDFCVHLRLTDTSFLACSEKLVMEILHQHPASSFYVCTDDIDRAKHLFSHLKSEQTFFSRNDELTDFGTLMIAKSLIISCSSFSWWACKLNNNIKFLGISKTAEETFGEISLSPDFQKIVYNA